MYQMMTPYSHVSSQMQISNPQPVYLSHPMPRPQRYRALPQNKNIVTLNSSNVIRMPVCVPNPVMSSTIIYKPTPRTNVNQKRSMPAKPAVIPLEMRGDLFSCHLLGQLKGHYQRNGCHGEHLEIKLVSEKDSEYAVVRRHCSHTKEVFNLHIFDDTSRFTLCSLGGQVLAVMPKGMSMKHSIIWFTNKGLKMEWYRTGEVNFKLSSVESASCRSNSIATESTKDSPMSTSMDQSNIPSTDVCMSLPLELLKSDKHSGEALNYRNESSCILETQGRNTSYQLNENVTEDALFGVFQCQCRQYKSLLEKVLNWGISLTPYRPVSEKEILEVTHGRIWLSIRLIIPNAEEEEKYGKVINDLKGAYQETKTGVYFQVSDHTECTVQHRLKKSSLGLFMIEENSLESDVWRACVKEHPYGNWVDLKNNGMMYKVQLVPMLSILNEMKKEWSDIDEMERYFDFLFKSSDLKNAELKQEDLDETISNLNSKLENEYKLSFAARIASIANSIALDMD